MMHPSNLKYNIDEIINTRQPLVNKIDNLCGRLKEVDHLLQETHAYVFDESEKFTEEQKQQAKTLPIETLLEHSRAIQDQLATLKGRFSRGTLNIGVIGRARQGKSRLLQSLTGLTRREIPDADGMHCTGVRSTICHQAGIETYAEVYFYTESEFLQQVIAPYFQQLQLGARPLSLSELGRNPLNYDIDGGAVARAKLEHLKKYQNCLDHYKEWLKSSPSSPLRITKEDIPKFITQYDPDDSSVAFYNYLAVKEVRIFCPFPDESVGRIAVVDMPGLGDTGIGDAERLVNTLGQDIDLILFVRMPKQTGDYWADVDVQLYDIANRALQGTSLESWAFQILNQLADGSNDKNCRDLCDTIHIHHLNVARTIITNCADAQDVQSKVLLPALDHLNTHIGLLDQRFVKMYEEQIMQLRTQLNQLADEIGKIIHSNQISDDMNRTFNQFFDELWENLQYALQTELRNPLWQTRRREDPYLKEAVTKALANARENTGIPSIEELRKKATAKANLPVVYYELINHVRGMLISNFQSQLDQSLRASMNEVKGRIATVFLNNGFANFVHHDHAGFIEKILVLLEKDPDRIKREGLQKLYDAFKELWEFQLIYRGLVQPRIRQHLDYLTPPGADGTNDADVPVPETSVEGVFDQLTCLQSEALSKIEEELEKLLWEPSMAAFAIVEDFLDSILRIQTAESSWRDFLTAHREDFWPKEFRCQYLLSRIRKLAHPDYLSLMIN